MGSEKSFLVSCWSLTRTTAGVSSVTAERKDEKKSDLDIQTGTIIVDSKVLWATLQQNPSSPLSGLRWIVHCQLNCIWQVLSMLQRFTNGCMVLNDRTARLYSKVIILEKKKQNTKRYTYGTEIQKHTDENSA